MIPLRELQIDFARSGGPGGQNVNKTSTKVILRWRVGESHAFNDLQKARIRHKLASRLNNQDEIVIASSEERSQLQNKNNAIARLNSLVKHALIIPKARRATKPTYSSKLKRLAHKTKRSLSKRARRTPLSF